jgi:predicted nucleotidyltransferase component of viral defense system
VRALLERKFVDFYARSSRVPLDVAERDVVLTYVLKILSEGVLAKLSFKGGTCLKKLFFGNSGRFSMDLDFTSVGISVDELKKALMNALNGTESYGLKFKVEEDNVREGFGAENVSYVADVSYAHEWNSSDFMLEVSYRESPILPQAETHQIKEEMYFKYLEFPTFSINCLQKEELLAEKIRAAFQRIQSRDLFDLYSFSGKNVDKVKLRKLVVLKCWNAREPFNPDLLFGKISGEEYDWEDLQRLVRKKSLPTQATVVKKVLAEYSFLKDLDNDLLRIVKDSKTHKEQEFVNSFKKSIAL